MTFSEYWAALRLKNPKLSDEDTKMSMTVGSFKKQLRKAHFEGWSSRTGGHSTSPFSDLFEMFGGKK